ncbi:glycerophosphodiester phosphodiesterase [Paenibacillus macerans]|uniref:glycerophosphodiester phosphodiesterase n=1 Tax=Paenibacillus macerans TaxID=44252 RepID=UPI002041ADEA|nr:glycerophosphodiester phosphodiesterase [Paenibacillus macerans]MCM3702439.1 glycerophosphodiester phosphodiesterase [Paenibacillus macerans]
MKRFPLVTAHTGCMGNKEHSLESLHSALALGADIYEDDIRVTRDGELVLSHDDEVLLADGRQGRIADMTLAELHESLAEPLTDLETVLRMVKAAGKTMNLDIKTAASLEPVFALIARLDMAGQVFLSGCEYPAAIEADRYGRHINKLLNVDINSFQRMKYADAAQKACVEGRETGCFGLNVPYQLVRPELLEIAERESLAVYVWTVSDAADMRRMADMGVASITTRELAKLMTVKAEWNLQRRVTVE